MRRITAGTAAVLGVALIALPFAMSLFPRTSSAEQVTDRFRNMMSEDGLVELRTDFETVRGTGEQLIDELLPRLADELGMTPEELDGLIHAEYPALAVGVDEVPTVLAFVDPVIDTLEADASDFRSADAIPFGDVPITVGPWVFIGLGAAFLVVAGAVAADRRSALLAALVLGTTVAAAPFVVSFPQKASDGEQVAEVARIGLSQDGADTAQHAMVVLDAMFAEIDDQVLPDLEQQLDLSSTELSQFLATEFPLVSEGLARWDEIGPKGHSLADKQTASVDDFAAADRIPFTALPWLLVGAGAVLAVVAAFALGRTGRRSSPASDRGATAGSTPPPLDDASPEDRTLAPVGAGDAHGADRA